MKDYKNDSDSAISRFGRDKRERTVTATSERVERRPRVERDAADSERPPVKRTSYNPNFTSDNRPAGDRDDRPRRAYGDKPSFGDRDRKPYGEKPAYGDRKPYGDKPAYGPKKYGDKPAYGDRDRKPYGERSFGDKPAYGDRKPYGDKPAYGPKKYGDKPAYGDRDRKPYGDKPAYGDRDRKPYGDRDQKPSGERSFGDKPAYGDRKPYGDKPAYGPKKYGDKPAYGDRDRKPYGDKPAYGDRKPYGDRDQKPYGERSFGDKPAYGDRKPYGDKPSFGDRKPYDRDRRPSGDRPAYGDRKPYGERSFGDKPAYGDRDRKPYNSGFRKRDDKPASYPKFNPDKQIGEVRLNRFVAQSGVCSRREADDYITAGLVSVNGTVITQLGTKVMPTDEVKFNDSRVQGEKKVYLVLNKPKGYVTSLDDPHATKLVTELVKDACTERIYPVGRLDKNSLGLLMFTNDGDLTKQLTHPGYQKKKIYQVGLDKPLTRADMDQIAQGITLEDGEIHADEVSYVKENKQEIGIEIHSGRNRIVRRIFEHLGYEIKKLDRVYYAGLTKKNINRGRWRFLTTEEVQRLKSGQYE